MAQALSELMPGSLLNLNESVSGQKTSVHFLVCAHNHHATGRTTLCRKELFGAMRFNGSTSNVYKNSEIDLWLTGTYKKYLDEEIQADLVTVPLGDGYLRVDRDVFLFSGTEVGLRDGYMSTDGTPIPYFNSNSRRIAYQNTYAYGWWLRSLYIGTNDTNFLVYETGELANGYVLYTQYIRPVFTLSSSIPVSDTADSNGAYTIQGPQGVWVKQNGIWIKTFDK